MREAYTPQQMSAMLGTSLENVLEALYATGNRVPAKPGRDGAPPEFRAAAFADVQRHLGRRPMIYGVSELPTLDTSKGSSASTIRGA